MLLKLLKLNKKNPKNVDSKISHPKQLGIDGELFVANWLKAQGFKILEKNYRKRFGEIDIIASKAELIVFVEVKTRKNSYFNQSLVITETKKQKIVLTARNYIAKENFIEKVFRFDVALLEFKKENFNLNYIENAFYG